MKTVITVFPGLTDCITFENQVRCFHGNFKWCINLHFKFIYVSQTIQPSKKKSKKNTSVTHMRQQKQKQIESLDAQLQAVMDKQRQSLKSSNKEMGKFLRNDNKGKRNSVEYDEKVRILRPGGGTCISKG